MHLTVCHLPSTSSYALICDSSYISNPSGSTSTNLRLETWYGWLGSLWQNTLDLRFKWRKPIKGRLELAVTFKKRLRIACHQL